MGLPAAANKSIYNFSSSSFEKGEAEAAVCPLYLSLLFNVFFGFTLSRGR